MNYEVFLPDYDCSILGIPNSILAHYGAKPHHKTLPVLDEKLRRNHKNVVLLVLDGMGMEVLKAHSPNGFLANNCVAQLSSVYPCTTVSALTTLETGLTPIEHGWLGWAHYFKELGKSVELYTNKESGTEKSVSELFIPWQIIGYKIYLHKSGKQIQALSVAAYHRSVNTNAIQTKPYVIILKHYARKMGGVIFMHTIFSLIRIYTTQAVTASVRKQM